VLPAYADAPTMMEQGSTTTFVNWRWLLRRTRYEPDEDWFAAYRWR